MRRKLIAGNWKMNLTRETSVDLAAEVRLFVEEKGIDHEVLLAPPFPYLEAVRGVIEGSRVLLGAQDVSFHPPGAFTGEVSAEMLLDLGCARTIVGHSERRESGETDEIVHAKARRAADLGLGIILCVGEREEERARGEEKRIVERQLRSALAGFAPPDVEERVVVAYEPVWAIGTGKTATAGDAEEMHRFARGVLSGLFGEGAARSVRVLYGGSVKPSNAAELLREEDIDGALVGGASLDGASFAAILSA
ncbi:MAG: triose-phosphate isomerase [Candidatus Eisenbacteria bacterium]